MKGSYAVHGKNQDSLISQWPLCVLKNKSSNIHACHTGNHAMAKNQFFWGAILCLIKTRTRQQFAEINGW
jgi:hypothetical protein